MAEKPLKIGMIGCGVVGTGVARLLLEQKSRLNAKARRELSLVRVAVRDAGKSRDPSLAKIEFTPNWNEIVNDPSIDVVVELAGGVDWTREAVLKALAAGKHVVTANKALLAIHGNEIFDAARKHQVCVAFEACVAGGIPIIGVLTQGLSANQITGLRGILNGTCNFILTAMSESGASYQEALKEAQTRGFAEADPSLDVNGTDTAHKLLILVQIAFGQTLQFEKVDRKGIDSLDSTDIRFAMELGYGIKLLAEAWLNEGRLTIHVSPVLVRGNSPLAQVRGAYNAIQVIGDAVGDTYYQGLGAGRMPTASSVVADLIDIAIGRAQNTFRSMKLWSAEQPTLALLDNSLVRSRYYLRLLVDDRPGVLAEVTSILAKHLISIASIIQHEAAAEGDTSRVQLVIMTHVSKCAAFLAAVKELGTLSFVTGNVVNYPVED